MEISRQTARRFILGRQGLWPGRRWRGERGTEQAMRAMEHLQLDPLGIMARAQDLMLHSRVIDYMPDDWARLTYEKRRFFDWGGWLAVRPMEELPYWRNLMRRERENGHWREVEHEHHAAIVEMRQALRERRTIANRDFAMASRKRTDSYRGRKDSAVALYYLWRVGEAMVHHRERFERVYARTEAIAPSELLEEASDPETEDFMRRKHVAFEGISALTGTSYTTYQQGERGAAIAWRNRALERGDLIEVTVDGWRGPRWALASDREAIETVAAGRVPRGWKAKETTTTEEATFLAPLDPVSARKRAKPLFDFDYIWEVYTPAPKRKFGYYALPVLWGDRLVARFDGRFDRSTSTFAILGFWPEEAELVDDEGFHEAFARGVERMRAFLGAGRLDVAGIAQGQLRRALMPRRGGQVASRAA
ncbi:MAG TPA: crosslink repair DNA glycosylase YcaQ family protein [Candidatus Limnocylindrales bacterium]|nr:crosslink repair DNA glycosylase YcaQ family protein [Candidatus Limnocylindrales bacterium]